MYLDKGSQKKVFTQEMRRCQFFLAAFFIAFLGFRGAIRERRRKVKRHLSQLTL